MFTSWHRESLMKVFPRSWLTVQFFGSMLRILREHWAQHGLVRRRCGGGEDCYFLFSHVFSDTARYRTEFSISLTRRALW